MSQSPTQSPISIHAPRTGSDASERACGDRPRKFQSTLPARGATRDGDGGDLMEVISIHAPRTGSDEGVNQLTIREVFQSTLPARGATLAITMRTFRACYFNPRSPHGERRAYHTTCDRVADHFNPRSPHGERRGRRAQDGRRHAISIHAPRTGSDKTKSAHVDAFQDFNPRSPHGERRFLLHKPVPCMHFNPRSPHGERRTATIARLRPREHFNPRSPHGERLATFFRVESQ